jgi:hypothetical protein
MNEYLLPICNEEKKTKNVYIENIINIGISMWEPNYIIINTP